MTTESERVKQVSQIGAESVGLGGRIAKARRDAGIRTQTAFARQLGVTRSAVSEWERNKSEPSTRNLARIAQLTNKDFDWLATGRSKGSDEAEKTPVDPLAKLALDRITPDTPLRLSVAVALAYPDRSMTANGLRKEAQKGRLILERTAGKYYTTLAAIARMRELCRQYPRGVPQLNTSSAPECESRHDEISGDAVIKAAQAAYRTIADLEEKLSPSSHVNRPQKRKYAASRRSWSGG